MEQNSRYFAEIGSVDQCGIVLAVVPCADFASQMIGQFRVDLTQTHWYVVYTKPRKEEFAEFCLRLRGVEVFLPRLLFPKSLRKRKRVVPLFPNYLFTRIYNPDQYHCVLWTPGVKRFVSFNGAPAPLDDSVVTFLMQRASPDGVIMAHSNLSIGQEVEITGGPFEGLIGIIQEAPGAKGRVNILMTLLSRQVKVEVPIHFVSCGWVTHSPKATRVSFRSYLPQVNN